MIWMLSSYIELLREKFEHLRENVLSEATALRLRSVEEITESETVYEGDT